PRLRQRLLERGVVRDVHLLRPKVGGLCGEALDAGAGDQDGDVAPQLHGLAEHAERVLLALAVVVLEADERAHKAFPSSRDSTLFSGADPSSSMRSVSPRGGGSPIA